MENNRNPHRQVFMVDPVFQKWVPGGVMVDDRLLLPPENVPFAIDVTCPNGAAHLAAAKTANQIIERIML